MSLRYQSSHIEPTRRTHARLVYAVFDNSKLIYAFTREPAARAYAGHLNKKLGKQ